MVVAPALGGILSTRSLWALRGYLEKLGVDLHGGAYIFRNRSGARYSVDTLGDDFRDVRIIEFGSLGAPSAMTSAAPAPARRSLAAPMPSSSRT